jgi:hypothetical protein
MSLARAPKSLTGTASRRVQLILFAAAGVVILASCSPAGDNAESESSTLIGFISTDSVFVGRAWFSPGGGQHSHSDRVGRLG